MVYFQARSDLRFVNEFRNRMIELLGYENRAQSEHKDTFSYLPFGVTKKQAAQHYAAQHPEYVALRKKVNSGVRRATNIALFHGVPIIGQSVSPPAVGGALIPFSLFDVALNDTTHGGITATMIVDAIDQTIGCCQDQVKREWRNLINPLYWIRELLFFILRIPFILIQATGFDTDKVEEHLVGKVLKFVFLIAIVYTLMRLGFSREQLVSLIEKILPW